MATSPVTPAPSAAPVSTTAPSTPAVATPASTPTATPSGAEPSTGGSETGTFDLSAALDAMDSPSSATPAVVPAVDAKPADDKSVIITDPGKVDPLAALEDDEYNGELPAPDKEEGDLLTYKKGRLERWNAAMKTVHTLEEKIPGFNVEKAEQNYQKAIGADQLIEDFHSADPANIDSFLGFWGQQNGHALGMMAVRLPGILQKVNPEAYDALVGGAFSQKFNSLYSEAIDAATRTGNDNFLKAVQVIDHHLNGNFKTAESFKATSPQDAREQNLRAREENLNRQTAAGMESQIKSYESGIVQDVNGAKTSAIEEGLAPVKEYFKDRPREWQHAVRDLEDAIKAKIASSREWSRETASIKQTILTALKSGQKAQADQAKLALVSQYKNMYAAVVKANRKQIIQGITKGVVTASAEANKEHASVASRGSEPVTSGVGAGAGKMAIDPKKFTTLEEAFKAYQI